VISLRRTTELSLATLFTVLATIGGIASYSSTIRESGAFLDLQQRQIARYVGDLTFVAPGDASLPPHDVEDDYVVEVTYRDGRPAKTSDPSAVIPDQKATGFSEFDDATGHWRVFSLVTPERTVQVAQRTIVREELAADAALRATLPFLVAIPLSWLIPVIAVLIWLGITSGLNNIRVLVRQIRSRTPDDLSTISTQRLPKDLVPLVTSLNNLLEKLGRSLTMERRFSDLAAHQLRTPQAGIKLLLQLFARADTEEERQALLNDLMSSNERAMHMTEQLLGLARVSHQPVQLETVNLQIVTASAVADFGGILDTRKFALELNGGEDALIHTDASLLRVMIDNVLDNAIKYSPSGSKIDVRIEDEALRWLLSISDEGPGIAPEQRLAAFQRFNRLHANDREGAGLGLPIVADIARRLEIEIRLLVPIWGTGLRFEMAIPKP